ncbi:MULTISPECIES: ArsR/SmtB family transcription factor [unclassified Shinella]|jgi:ubiquinone/menaquinone biosynthesis C-methylase UbiE/DNA-binding transcriptional ArsR family regulator|uniref:ArsR/SmtB family transcription factor n=1 Tax=unclassified Shinella TaxID=2643062 RepID=UPI0003C54C2A|nr:MULTISPECIES: metalloregulator ArsR/SmtB family transcription factor [unclassified Shinella]MCA0343080.1 metalloregulator ArsR/SmtB family transcription factor [Pseudomonadota bacterium]EYR77722.1 methylase involved in ubiquinone/menaquinone biosynthesis [Shinella sp. DD12]KNY16047.1 ArsR family transcriptional regulator [Shinella sp. SUS2]KOC73361.1 ArsR family transcriptional regulator [Shinella sp. GWS1]MCO5149398.1 metalloregulator ArsR/SmtB family transcription factor [Shinella sp.]
MGDMQKLGLDDIVEILKAAGEPTRLRLLALLSHGDLTVTDLTDILGQSQPRISRHLKLLAEAALVDRYQEGAWAFFRLSQGGPAVTLARQLLESADPADAVFARDDERLRVLKKIRADKAQAYFSRNAAEWDAVRRLHVSEAEVEARLAQMIGTEPVDGFLDLGTGTGRILQLFEGLYKRGVGVDASRDMLAVARANLDRAGITKASIRHGDIFNLPLERDEFDVVTIHQVLHFLDEPDAAVAEAARMLAPGGRLAIIDLAPHALEHLRDEHAHIRLGFSHQTLAEWLEKAGLVVEEVVDLKPAHSAADALTVTIWLARDQRERAADTIAIRRRS